jgi:nucleotide-binding universal stress UspA family protein
MIKDMVVNLAVGRPRDAAADYAISLAGAHGAHLTGVAFALEAVIPGTVMGGVPYDAIHAARMEAEKAQHATIEAFEKAAGLAGVSFESRKLHATMVGAGDLFGKLVRRFDLSVVGQAEPNVASGEELIIEAALFQSGRPLIVVPYIQRSGHTLERVLVGWDGSRTAARAIGDAMPLLSRAKAVDVVIVATERAQRDEITGAAMGQHLARHGIKVDVKRIVADDTDVANTMLSYAADTAADFIVMGGYGHSRLREFILGGATRGILESMTVPVLMAH